jgi:hypothetical protein
VADTGTLYVPAGVDVEPPLPSPPDPPPEPPLDVAPELVQLVTPIAISSTSPHTSNALRRLQSPIDKRTSPQTSGAKGDLPRCSRTLAATVPVEICRVTLLVAPDPTVGLAGLKMHKAFDGSVVQPSVNVPCEPFIVVS